jgi:Uncharacterized protein conserved in bacteria
MPDMKLLFDQNISFRILRLMPDTFTGCQHVKFVGLNDRNDWDIWQYAKLNDFTIVTFDADFFDISLLKGFPPKIVWLRTGNLITQDIAECIVLNHAGIVAMISNPNQSCIEIY